MQINTSSEENSQTNLSANWWFDPANGQCFVFRSHIFFSLRFFLRLPLYNTFRLD